MQAVKPAKKSKHNQLLVETVTTTSDLSCGKHQSSSRRGKYATPTSNSGLINWRSAVHSLRAFCCYLILMILSVVQIYKVHRNHFSKPHNIDQSSYLSQATMLLESKCVSIPTRGFLLYLSTMTWSMLQIHRALSRHGHT